MISASKHKLLKIYCFYCFKWFLMTNMWVSRRDNFPWLIIFCLSKSVTYIITNGAILCMPFMYIHIYSPMLCWWLLWETYPYHRCTCLKIWYIPTQQSQKGQKRSNYQRKITNSFVASCSDWTFSPSVRTNEKRIIFLHVHKFTTPCVCILCCLQFCFG